MKKVVTEVVKRGNTSSFDTSTGKYGKDYGNKASKSWEYTLNNFSVTDVEFFKNLECNQNYCCEEVGPECGTPHIHGRIVFKRPYRFTQLKKLHGKVHWEITDPTVGAKDKNYLKKIDSVCLFDIDNRRQGERTDLMELKNEIMNGRSVKSIRQENPMTYHQYGRTLEKLEQDYEETLWKTEMTQGIWLWGPTGVGKTHYAMRGYHPDTHYNWSRDNGWWDNYRGQEVCIFNDYRGEIPYNDLLKLCDKWPFEVSRRGKAPMPFLSKKIIITSSLPPEKIYKNREVEDSLEQFERRFKVFELKKDEPFPIELYSL